MIWRFFVVCVAVDRISFCEEVGGGGGRNEDLLVVGRGSVDSEEQELYTEEEATEDAARNMVVVGVFETVLLDLTDRDYWDVQCQHVGRRSVWRPYNR